MSLNNVATVVAVVLAAVLVDLAHGNIQAPSSDSIVRIPQDGRVEISIGKRNDSAIIICEPADESISSADFTWYKVHHKTNEETEIKGNFDDVIGGIVINDGELTIPASMLKHNDMYRCKIDEKRFANFRIIDLDIVSAENALQFRVDKFLRSYSVVESEDLKINCYLMNRTAEGFDINEVAIKWYMWDEVEDLSFEKTVGNCSAAGINGTKWKEIIETSGKEEPHIKFLSRDGLSKAVMKIEDAVLTDRRGYKCVAYNITAFKADAESDACSEGVAFVRVKGRYAALWPFLGIVAEVIFLLAVIGVVEKRRANKEALEEEEEEEAMANNPSNLNDDKNAVRHRRQ